MGQSQGATPPPAPEDSDAAGGASPLERGLHAIVATFFSYATVPAPGAAPSLSPGAFRRLLRRELGHQLTDTGASDAVAAVFALLDANGDHRVTFDEYWQLVAWICHVIWHRCYGDAAPAGDDGAGAAKTGDKE